ncbi:spore germination protein [Virgibacillus sp. W0181]|uniref:spore germination protein n=1 Tax=Virgibacillus sp. W0181 TaxID=3391581 RepID=UPI003F453CC4
MNKRSRSKNTNPLFPSKVDELRKTLEGKFENNPDLSFSVYEQQGEKIAIFYISYLVEEKKVEQSILQPLLNKKEAWTNDSLLNDIPLSNGTKHTSLDDILGKLIIGEVFIYIEGEKEIVSYLLLNKEKRSLEKAETESIVLGPQIAFTESLVTNLNIVRWRVRSTDLVLEEIQIGKSIPRTVRLVYMKSIANEEDVQTMRQRLKELDIDELEDSVVLKEYIEDSNSSLFPQLQSTELPDKFTYAITKGKVGVLVENSPTAIFGPSSLFSFLESTEDLYMRWKTGTMLRFLRFLAIFISMLLTPTYVAAMTYQYTIIPMQLLVSIGQTRAAVPFPPVIEAILLEFLIEVLREAGARLPTKVAQTMGVVGGIVIGQAVVEAGLTSNILIIIAAASAIASYTSPSYLMGTTVRLLRLPLIILAALFGLFGVMFGLCFLIIHLLRMTSLGRPYLVPLYPLQLQDFNKVFFRSPLQYNYKHAKSYRPKKKFRFNKKDALIKRDIDE